MEMLNKLRSTVTQAVSQTVSQVSGVLPGNPVTREYDVQQHVASAGPGQYTDLANAISYSFVSLVFFSYIMSIKFV